MFLLLLCTISIEPNHSRASPLLLLTKSQVDVYFSTHLGSFSFLFSLVMRESFVSLHKDASVGFVSKETAKWPKNDPETGHKSRKHVGLPAAMAARLTNVSDLSAEPRQFLFDASLVVSTIEKTPTLCDLHGPAHCFASLFYILPLFPDRLLFSSQHREKLAISFHLISFFFIFFLFKIHSFKFFSVQDIFSSPYFIGSSSIYFSFQWNLFKIYLIFIY